MIFKNFFSALCFLFHVTSKKKLKQYQQGYNARWFSVKI